MRLGKKGAYQISLMALLIIGIFGFLVWKVSTGDISLSQVQTAGGGEKQQQVACAVEDTTFSPHAVDAYDASKAIGGNHKISVNGGAWANLANAGSKTISPGDKVVLALGDGNDTYYTQVVSGTVPCSGTADIVDLGGNDKLYKNGSISIRVFNEEGNLVAEGTENETLAAADVVSLAADIEGEFETAAPYGGRMVIEYNSTAYDKVAIGQWPKCNVPTFKTSTYTDSKLVCYEFPALISTGKEPFTLTIDVDDSANPDSTAGHDIVLTAYTYNYYLNTDTAKFEKDVEDQDGTQNTLKEFSFTVQVD